MRSLKRHEGLLFALPALVVLALLIFYPLVETAILSLTDADGNFAGLANFDASFADRLTALSVWNTLYYVLVSMLFQIVLGTIAGILLNRKFRGQGAVRTLILIPWVVPGIVAATTWTWMFHNEFGIINYALTQAHIISAPLGWLTDASRVLPSLIAVNVWKMFPFVAVMVLAGLQTVPETLYEAARVDGAGFLDEVRYIMLPHLRPVLVSVSLLLFIWGFNGITIVYAMTRGGPANRSLILPIHIFRQAFELFEFNKAAALSICLFVALLVVIIAYMKLVPAHEEANENA